MALPQVGQLASPGAEVSAPPQYAAGPDDDRQPLDLETLRRYVNEFRDLTQEGRKRSLTAIDYYDDRQWSAEERAKLAARNQPDTVFNHIKIAVNGIIGVNARGKADPRAWPRTPGDEGSADVATDILRYVADINRFQRTKLDCLKDMLVPGSMAVIIGADEDLNPTITQVRWEELIYDPRSRRPDFKDGRFLGVAKWMYADDLEGLYPDKSGDIRHAVDSAQNALLADESMLDRPNWAPTTGWIDRRQRRLLIVELYYRHRGNWDRCVFYGSGILDEGSSPYLDHKGRPHCPIEAQSAYVDRENNRYGVVQGMISPQDEINKRRSKMLWLLSVRQLEPMDPAAIAVDADEARKEAAKPDGVIPFGYRVVPTNDMAAGQAELMADAAAMLERMAPNPAIVGRGGNDQSGRALLARQQGGLVELSPIYNAAEDWELRVYRQIWARVKQYWQAPQIIRVTDDEGAPKFVGVNQPVLGQPMPTIDPNAPSGVSLQQPVLGYKNQIGEMDVDIEVDVQQDVGTLQQEQFSDLIDMIRANPVYANDVPFEVLLRLSTIPHKQSVRDLIKEAREERQQQALGQQQQQQQVGQAVAASKIEESKAKTNLMAAQADAASAKAVLDLHSAGATSAAPILEGLHAGIADGNQQNAFMAAQAQPGPGRPGPQGAPS